MTQIGRALGILTCIDSNLFSVFVNSSPPGDGSPPKKAFTLSIAFNTLPRNRIKLPTSESRYSGNANSLNVCPVGVT